MSRQLIDITNVTDNVLEVFMDVKGGAEFIIVEHLTVTERHQLAGLLGETPTIHWLLGSSEPQQPAGPDYEQLILKQQEEQEG